MGFTAREHLTGADPENVKLRTLPPPSYIHLWVQYLDVAGDRQPNMAGLESITYADLDAWANCQPVNRCAFKFSMLRMIDRKFQTIRKRITEENKRNDGRTLVDPKAGH